VPAVVGAGGTARRLAMTEPARSLPPATPAAVRDLLMAGEMDLAMATLEDLARYVGELERLVDTGRRVRDGASAGGHARAQAMRSDPLREGAVAEVERLRAQFSGLSRRRAAELTIKALGLTVTPATVTRWHQKSCRGAGHMHNGNR